MTSGKIYIFFDTNMLESRFSKDCMYLSCPRFKSIYYTVEELILTHHLEDQVKLCISEISLQELKKHLISCYQSKSATLEVAVDEHKKVFGDLFEIYVDKKGYENKNAYREYIDSYYNNFFKERTSFLKIIPYPKDEETLKEIVSKAMHSIKPFSKANKKDKEYTDAGLKDALIFETILQYSRECLSILVSDDNDFKELLEDSANFSNIKLFSNKDCLKDFLLEYFNISDIEYKLTNILANDDYFIKTLFAEINFDENANYQFKKIFGLVENVDGLDGIEVKFYATINGEDYKFDIVYELNSKTLMEVIDFGECNEERI